LPLPASRILAARRGAVCDDGFTTLAARIVCNQLGFTGLPYVYDGPYFGPAPDGTPILLDDVECRAGDERLEDCPSSDWGAHNCSPQEAVSMQCGGWIPRACMPWGWVDGLIGRLVGWLGCLCRGPLLGCRPIRVL